MTYLTKILILHSWWHFQRSTLLLQHSSCTGMTNANVSQPLLSHQTAHIQSPIHQNFVINISHGVAVLTALSFVIPQAPWKWLSDRLHFLEFFTLSTINNIPGAQQVTRNPGITLHSDQQTACSESWSQRFRAQSQQAPHKLPERKH